MKLTGTEILSLPRAAVVNGDALAARTFTGVSTDSRSVARGDLFVALRGERFDGHAYVPQALARGAAAAVVERAFMQKAPAGASFLVVDNTLETLGHLARLHRDKFRVPVLAVAGSNGKTTTKEMIASVLASRYNVLKTQGNLNNQIGVPQTLFGLDNSHEIVVIELGTNHPGELAALCAASDPTHGILTNIGNEHLEFFHTLDGVAEEEGTLFEYLAHRRKGGTAFVNADDARVKAKAKGVAKCVTYGFAARGAAVRGKRVSSDAAGRMTFRFSGGRISNPVEVALGIPGEHNAANALAAAAVGHSFRVSAKEIAEALGRFLPAERRMQVMDIEGVLVYNDVYNANPDSTVAALRTLASAKISGKKIAVLADMRELGDCGAAEHSRVGREASALGIDYLLTFGELARYIHDAARVPFMAHYDQKNMLAEYLAELVGPGDAVLIKGSRGMKMEDIVTFLEERLHATAARH